MFFEFVEVKWVKIRNVDKIFFKFKYILYYSMYLDISPGDPVDSKLGWGRPLGGA